jgi:hypothetical protein
VRAVDMDGAGRTARLADLSAKADFLFRCAASIYICVPRRSDNHPPTHAQTNKHTYIHTGPSVRHCVPCAHGRCRTTWPWSRCRCIRARPSATGLPKSTLRACRASAKACLMAASVYGCVFVPICLCVYLGPSAHEAAPATVRAIFDDVLRAMEALHAEGLVHGRFDADCVLVRETETVRERRSLRCARHLTRTHRCPCVCLCICVGGCMCGVGGGRAADHGARVRAGLWRGGAGRERRRAGGVHRSGNA